MTEQWLSIVEYARTYKVSDMTVRRRIKTGKLHAILQDGKYFIPITGNDARGSGAKNASEAAHSRVAEEQNEHEGPSHPPYYQKSKPAQMHEISLTKGHPAAQKTLAQPLPQRPAAAHMPYGAAHGHASPGNQPLHQNPARQTVFHPHSHPTSGGQHGRQDLGGEGNDATIPSSLRRPLLSQEASLVDTRALLAFCEASLRKMAESERRTVERFKSKLEALEATLSGRDLEIKTLRQQLEDLQLLVKILEKRRSV